MYNHKLFNGNMESFIKVPCGGGVMTKHPLWSRRGRQLAPSHSLSHFSLPFLPLSATNDHKIMPFFNLKPSFSLPPGTDSATVNCLFISLLQFTISGFISKSSNSIDNCEAEDSSGFALSPTALDPTLHLCSFPIDSPYAKPSLTSRGVIHLALLSFSNAVLLCPLFLCYLVACCFLSQGETQCPYPHPGTSVVGVYRSGHKGSKTFNQTVQIQRSATAIKPPA